MKSKVKIPWFVNDSEELLVSYVGYSIDESDEGSGWRGCYGGVEPVGPRSPYPSRRDVEPTHLLTWKESEDIKGSLIVTGIHRGRSSATMKIELTRDDGKLIKGTMNVNYQPMLAAGMVNGRAGATIRARKRGNNYLFELVEVDIIQSVEAPKASMADLEAEVERLRAENAELQRQLADCERLLRNERSRGDFESWRSSREHAATVMYKAEYGKDGS